MIRISRDPDLSRKIVRRSQGDDAKRYVVSVQSIHDFVDGAVSADRGDDIHAGARRASGVRRCSAGLEGDHRLDQMAFVANPGDQVPHVGPIRAYAVHDERDVLGAHAAG